MFSNEVRLAARLTHPNVIQTYGANEDHGRLYVATEYLDGQPWSRVRNALWNRGSLPYRLHLKVLAEALSGLQYAHELRDFDGTPLQIVHCDMSPQNVFVTYDGLIKLVDFGVARAVVGGNKPSPELSLGKLAYIAPEQARGGEVDRRADIFAVGVMLWEAMTGRPLLQNEDGSEARQHRISGIEPRVRAIAPDAPPALADICDRALALEPEERFATAAEFRDALLGFLGEEMVDADRLSLGELVGGTFQKERARLHAIVDQHMRPATNPSNSVEHLVIALQQEEPPVARTQRADRTELASVSRRGDEVSMIDVLNSAGIQRMRSKPLPLIAIGVALLSFTITWIVSRPEPQAVGRTPTATHAEPHRPAESIAREEHASNDSARVTVDRKPLRNGDVRYGLPSLPQTTIDMNAATDPGETSSATTMHLTISARPESAVLYLDGIALSDNPFSARVRADHQLHTIRASGIGLVAQERTTTFDRDHAVSLDLGLPRVAHPGVAAARPARNLPGPNHAAGSAALLRPDYREPAGMRARLSEMYDAPLRTGKISRPIYEDDPYLQP
jgi:serine/threonine-protein kinase